MYVPVSSAEFELIRDHGKRFFVGYERLQPKAGERFKIVSSDGELWARATHVDEVKSGLNRTLLMVRVIGFDLMDS